MLRVLLLTIFLPVVICPPVSSGSTLFVGDSLTGTVPGYVELVGGGERAITYHIADSILHIQDAGYYQRIVLELGIHGVHGSDRLYYNNPDLFKYRYWQLIDSAREHAGEVVIVNIPWLDWNSAKSAKAQEFNALIDELAGRMHICVADAWGAMEQCGPPCIGEDGFHPNARGHELIAREVLGCY